MDFPTSISAYRWCTTLLNRVAPTAQEQIDGFRGGDPVPPGNLNDLFGVLSDIVAWLRYGPFAHSNPIYSAGMLHWLGTSGANLTWTIGGNGLLEVENDAGGTAQAHGVTMVYFGGDCKPPEVTIGAHSGGNARVTVTMLTPSGTAQWEDAAISGTGTITLTHSGGTLPDDSGVVYLEGPFRFSVVVEAGGTASDSVRLDAISLDFSP